MVDRRLTDPEYARRLIERQDNTVAAQALKAALAAEGFKYHLSLYGVIHDTTDETNTYRRIEVLAHKFWTGADVTLIKAFFEVIIPPLVYSMWTYDRETQTINYRGGWT
jgi:membrane protein YdbS with pleckstrin-like domain